MTVFLYVLNTLADWEISYITTELNSGRFFNKLKRPIKVSKVSDTLKPIQTMGGITITPDECIDNVTFDKSDILILPEADSWFDNSNKTVLNLISKLLDKNVTVAAICGATLALAKSGVLNTRKHTSNDKEFLKMNFSNYSGEKLYINEPVVSDGNLITATGLAPLEFSYEVLKKTNAIKPNTLEAWYQL